MSTILAARVDFDHCVFASDSQITYGWSKRIIPNHKVAVVEVDGGNVVAGVSGDVRWEQLLKVAIKRSPSPYDPDTYYETPDIWVTTALAPAIIEVSREGGWERKDDDTYKGGYALLWARHTLIELSVDLSAIEHSWSAIGSGYREASGAFMALGGGAGSVVDKARKAVEVATKIDLHSSGPVVVERFDHRGEKVIA